MRRLDETQKKLFRVIEHLTDTLDKTELVTILKDYCETYLGEKTEEHFDKIQWAIMMIAMKSRKEDFPDEDILEITEDLNDSMEAVRAVREQLSKKKED